MWHTGSDGFLSTSEAVCQRPELSADMALLFDGIRPQEESDELVFGRGSELRLPSHLKPVDDVE